MLRLQLLLESCEVRILESTLGQQLLSAYRRLPDLHQRWVWAGGVALLAALLILLVLMPATRYALAGMQSYQRANEDYTWLQAHRAEAEQIAAARNAATDGIELQPMLLNLAKEHEVRPSRFEQQLSGDLRVWLEGAHFADVVAWIDQLRQRHQIYVSRLEVDAQAGERVTVRVDIAS